MTTSRKRGRRPKSEENTLLVIKRAAKDSLAQAGRGRPTLRAIAERAGVDQALVLYYFGSMDDLYSELALDGMRELLNRKALASPTSPSFGSSLITAIFDDSSSSSSRLPFETLFYGAIAGAQFRPLLAKLISEEMPERLSLDRRSKRDQLAVSLLVAQIQGLGVVRHILKLEPVASASIQTIAKEYGPSLNLVLSRAR